MDLYSPVTKLQGIMQDIEAQILAERRQRRRNRLYMEKK